MNLSSRNNDFISFRITIVLQVLHAFDLSHHGRKIYFVVTTVTTVMWPVGD